MCQQYTYRKPYNVMFIAALRQTSALSLRCLISALCFPSAPKWRSTMLFHCLISTVSYFSAEISIRNILPVGRLVMANRKCAIWRVSFSTLDYSQQIGALYVQSWVLAISIYLRVSNHWRVSFSTLDYSQQIGVLYVQSWVLKVLR